MTSSLPGHREPPESRHDLSTYWGRVKHSADISDPRTLLTSSVGLENAKQLVTQYKQGYIRNMNAELWQAKKIIDSTLHPDTGEPVLLPFRMSCFVISNLVVAAGMLQPNLGKVGTVSWQIANQSLNVAINYSNANKSAPLSTQTMVTSYLSAVTASCSVALGLHAVVPRLKRLSPTMRTTLSRLIPWAAVASAGALNVILMRYEEIRTGIDVYPVESDSSSSGEEKEPGPEEGGQPESLGKSQKAATLAVTETAASRVFNATPIMGLTPLILMRFQKQEWLKQRPRLVMPVNLGLILVTSIVALPLALAVFPQYQQIEVDKLEEKFVEKAGKGKVVQFNRGL